MNNLTKYIYNIYNSWRKVIIWILCFVFTIASIKVYINNFLWIQKSLYDTNLEFIQIKSKISYYKIYKIPYLQSEYATKFLKHQNGLPDSDDEIIIKLQKNDKELNQKNIWISYENSTNSKSDQFIKINTRYTFWIYKIKTWFWV